MIRIGCPTCGRLKPAFVVVDGKCDEDRRDEAREILRAAEKEARDAALREAEGR